MIKRALLTAFLGIAAMTMAGAEDAHARGVFLELPWGMVQVDLNFDGEKDLIVHSFPEDELTTEKVQIQFLVFDPSHKDGLRPVRVEGQDQKMFVVPTQENVDCRSHLFRLMRNGRRIDVIVIQREGGTEAGSDGPVTFVHYKLMVDKEVAKETGGTPYMFKKSGEYVTEVPFCDVNDAFVANMERLSEIFADSSDEDAGNNDDKSEEDTEVEASKKEGDVNHAGHKADKDGK